MASITRVQVTPSQEMRICLLGSNGFYASTIQREVLNYSGEELSTSTIYRVLRSNGIRIRDYRQGIGVEAQSAMIACKAALAAWRGDNRSKIKRVKSIEVMKKSGRRLTPTRPRIRVRALVPSA